MAVKAVNFKMDEVEIANIRHVADVYHITLTDFIKDAIGEYLIKMKADPFYRLTVSVEEADTVESDEILEAINGMEDEDLAIARVERMTVEREV